MGEDEEVGEERRGEERTRSQLPLPRSTALARHDIEMENEGMSEDGIRSTHPVQIERLYMICRNPTPFGVSVDTSGLHTSVRHERSRNAECGGIRRERAMSNAGGYAIGQTMSNVRG